MSRAVSVYSVQRLLSDFFKATCHARKDAAF